MSGTDTVLPPPRRRRRWPRILAGALALVLVAVAALLALAYRHLDRNISTIDVTNDLGTQRPTPRATATAEATDSSPLNILVMGSDTRVGQGSRYGSSSIISGARSDTAFLVHLYAGRDKALVVSIPRDTWVEIPSCRRANGTKSAPQQTRFNTAFEIGGPACTIKTFEALSGVFVDHFVVVDFAGFKRIVDALGGVPICLTKRVDDPLSGLRLSAGEHIVSGEDALAFVRARKTLADGSDISRIARQQEFLSSMVRTATSTRLLLDPIRTYKVLDATTQSITTDTELGSLGALRSLATSLTGLDPSDITFVTLPWYGRSDGATVGIRTEAADEIFSAIRDDQPWPPPPLPLAEPSDGPLVTPPSAVRVRVLNASGVPGRAKEVAAQLTAQGYVVVGYETADSVGPTRVRYNPARDESARTLATSTGVATGYRVVDDALGATLVLEVGTDFTGVKRVAVGSASPTPSPSGPRTADEYVCS